MEYLQNDRFALAGYQWAQGQKIARKDWPSDDLELAYFNAGIYQSHVANGTKATALHCVSSPRPEGCASGIHEHPACWR